MGFGDVSKSAAQYLKPKWVTQDINNIHIDDSGMLLLMFSFKFLHFLDKTLSFGLISFD